MSHWVFMDYVSPAGTNLINKWSKKKLSILEREHLETLLGMLAKQKQWGEPDFKMLSGKKWQGMGEIRFKSEKGIPLRIAGMKGKIEGQYILLVGFSHRENRDPPDALDTAVERKGHLSNETGSICEHEEDNGEA